MSKVITEVELEVRRARDLHPPFPSLHHGVAVIREEYLEMEDEAFKKHVDMNALRKELIQLAAVCARMVEDVIDA